jgi:uncharacterized protein
MKPYHLGTFVLALLLAGAAAPLHAQTEECPAAGLPLWQAEFGDATVYLMGSVHLLRPEVYPLHDALYDAFDAAHVVAFELDLSQVAAAAPLMMQRGTYQDGTTLADRLPPGLYEQLVARVAELGLPAQLFAPMKPWLASLMLSSLVLQRGGYETAAGIDMHFFERAQAAGTPVLGLETVEEQLDVFEGLSPAGQVAMLESTIAELDDTLEQLDRATVLWRVGDAEGLARLVTESMADQRELTERILHERNRAWVPRIEALPERGDPAVVIVGVAHLVGEGSVIALLRERGHAVRPVQACPQ